MCSDASHRSYEDRRLAWGALTPAGFDVRIIPGNHLTMVEEPHAHVLARELQGCLDRASGAAGSGNRQVEEGPRPQETPARGGTSQLSFSLLTS